MMRGWTYKTARSFVHRALASEGATAAVEFAIIAPVMLLFTGGIIEFGRAFQVYEGVNRLATQYAIAWADCSDTPAGTCGTELSYYTNQTAIQNIVPQLQYSNVTLQMFQIQMATTSPYAVSINNYSYGGSLSTAQITAAQTALTAAAQAAIAYNPSNPPSYIYGVIVTVKYQHSLAYFQTLMSQFIPTALLAPAYTVVQLKS